MIRKFKINFAVCLGIAFIFRLLFINLGIISSLNATKVKDIKSKHFSEVMKLRKSVEAFNTAEPAVFSPVEICEENSNDEEDLSKKHSFVLIQFLYSLHPNKETFLSSNFHQQVSNFLFSSKKYLDISILRI